VTHERRMLELVPVTRRLLVPAEPLNASHSYAHAKSSHVVTAAARDPFVAPETISKPSEIPL
jgi:hypothetical protein